jgi:hypothetical protein
MTVSAQSKTRASAQAARRERAGRFLMDVEARLIMRLKMAVARTPADRESVLRRRDWEKGVDRRGPVLPLPGQKTAFSIAA